MRDLSFAAPCPPSPTVATPDDLSLRTAAIARAVADVIETTCREAPGADQAAGFLRTWADGQGDMPTEPGEADAPRAGTPLGSLVRRFGLDGLEVDLLLLAGLPEEHEGLAATLRSLHPLGEPGATVGLAALLGDGGSWRRDRLRHLLSSGAAVRHGLLRTSGSGSYFERSLALAEELWPALHGCDAWPASLRRADCGAPPPGLEPWLAEPDVAACVDVVRRGRRALVVVPHEEATVALARCRAISAAAGRPSVGAEIAVDDPAQVRLLLAHAVARDAVPVLVARGGPETPVVTPELGDFAGVVLVATPPGRLRPPLDRAVLSVDPGPVPMASVLAAWRAALPSLNGRSAELAGRHPLDPAVTASVALDLATTGEADTDADSSDCAGRVARAIRARAGVDLPSGVTLCRPRVDWSHLVLPADAADALRSAVDRLTQQATVLDDWGLAETAQARRGVRVLLCGPPGTGKSLAASALATAVETDLMVVDVSRLVSKWLGETEKNLAATFVAAERTRAVLLLDEADALFATRTEVSDAHDRYANLETAFLLQQLERFDGLVVLTSNLRRNIDPAFTRRIDVVVDLPLPDLDGREALWRQLLPARVLADDVDVTGLAALYAIPGGWIRNAALGAAFAAAAAGQPITQHRLVDAVRREYLKAATPFPGRPPRRRDDDET